jgi:y4mF family transcriptional regulator
MSVLSDFVKERRKEVNLTQEEFAERAGVALTVVRKIEQGKTNLNLDKVNLVLKMFGHELVPMRINEKG